MKTSDGLSRLRQKLERLRRQNLCLDMSRGKPEERQLDLSAPLLRMMDDGNFLAEGGVDVRNYGAYQGIPEARRLFGELLRLPPSQVLSGGNSSLNLISDALKRCYINGALPGDTPWCKLDQVRFICPAPGYDWHFHILETYHIEMLPVAMDAEGPDMEQVRRLAADPSVKGLICNPMYNNPTGITFSPRVVEDLAAMPTAAADFRLIWDHAYAVHHLYPDRRDQLADIYEACLRHGHADRVLMFASTSKITYAGAGIAALAGSPANIAWAEELIQYQLVCYDKVNQLRHVRFLPDLAAVEAHMKRHAAILRPKFELVLAILEQELGGSGLARWHAPLGGYFICLYTEDGCARRVNQLCQEAGVTLTPAGVCYPYGQDIKDNTIRIAPSYPSLEQLEQAMRILTLALKIVHAERREENGQHKEG
ncbi:MAG: aminotransferase class I/II-fold pyridoxal phosphate-dependent enzyme [Clostridia bacterium]|nr:aminotransferase class I/II-fold pyridoxal phosphate-dependent enzyme [Clostridia bacterium]